METKSYTYARLSIEAQGNAIEEVNRLHPIGTRRSNLDALVTRYLYNGSSSILTNELTPTGRDIDLFPKEDFEGCDPEYYPE